MVNIVGIALVKDFTERINTRDSRRKACGTTEPNIVLVYKKRRRTWRSLDARKPQAPKITDMGEGKAGFLHEHDFHQLKIEGN
jgi:hypothetical protein